MSDSQRWFFLIFTLVVGFLLYLLQPILTPFLVAALLAYLTDPMADRLEARGLSRTLSVVVVFLLMTAVLLLLVILLIPQLGYQLQVMLKMVPQVFTMIQTVWIPWLEQYVGVSFAEFDLQSVQTLMSGHWQQTGSLLKGLFSSVSQSGLALAAGWLIWF